jgi:hypothetical protein
MTAPDVDAQALAEHYGIERTDDGRLIVPHDLALPAGHLLLTAIHDHLRRARVQYQPRMGALGVLAHELAGRRS